MIPTRRTLRAVGAATLLSAFALAGCSDEEPLPEPTTGSPAPQTQEPTTRAPEQTQTPDDGEATTAPADDEDATDAAPEPTDELGAADDSFTITLPEGWEDAYDLVSEDGVLLAAKEIERKDEFFTNVVVTEEEYVSNLTSAVEEAAEQLAGEDGEYELLEPAPVDGNRAPGYTLVRDVQGSTVHQTQRWISHDGTLYVVTFSAIESQAQEAGQVLDEILASWTWES